MGLTGKFGRARVCAVLLGFVCVAAGQSVRYELRFPNAVHHEAAIRATFTGIQQPTLAVVMSRSSPGRYAVHEFAKNVYEVRAHDGSGATLPISRPSPYEWDISTQHGTVVFEYTLYGARADGTYDGIDETHAHLNMPATLVWARGFEHAPVSLSFEVPQGSGWTVATQLIPAADGTWTAPNLEWLMDSPAELSAHALKQWKVEDATFRLALHHLGSDEQARALAQVCKTIVLEEEGVFEALPKYDAGTYTFLVDLLPYVFGDGMEHRDSTVITGNDQLRNSSLRVAGAVSHEFFHSWNVKRIRPRSLEPFDLERANISGELWFAEGFTNYYGALTLARSGISTLTQFVGDLSGALNTILTAPGRNVFDVIDMSRLAPFVDAASFVDPANFKNTFISYYTYGEALALGIDLAIREKYPEKSLDSWMRTMWREHPDVEKPYTLDDLERSLAETVGDAEFSREVFSKHIYGMEPMPYEVLLKPAGIVLRKVHPNQAWLGAERLDFADRSAQLAVNTLRGSPLYEAGLDKGDRILKWDGKTFRGLDEFNVWLHAHKPGDHVRLNVKTFGRDEKEVEVRLIEDPNVELVTYEQGGSSLTAGITAFRQSWLGSKALHSLPKLDTIP
jgi:predicted metalloprotease with PDZ domain